MSKSQPAGVRTGRRPWASWPILAAALSLGLVALGVIVITIRQKSGEVKITAPDDKAIKVEKDGVVVVDPSKGNAVTRGPHELGKGSPSSAPITPRTKAIIDALEKPVAMRFRDDTPLGDVLNYIKQATKNGERDPGVPIYVDPVGLQEAEKSMTSTVKIDLEGTPLSATLPLVLDQLGLAYIPKDDLLFISSPEGVANERQSIAVLCVNQAPGTKAVMASLEKPISMPFADETSLEDVLEHVKKATSGPKDPGIQFYLDPIGLQEAERSATATITIDLEGVPLKTTLRHLLRQLELGYFVKQGVLHVTSIERVETELGGPNTPVKETERGDADPAGDGSDGAPEAGGAGGLGGEAKKIAEVRTKRRAHRASAETAFRPLFNGKDKTGWIESPKNKGEWTVVDGILQGQGSGEQGIGATLVTERKDFANFRLRAKFRYPEDGGGAIEVRYIYDAENEARSSYPVIHGVWPSNRDWVQPPGRIAKLVAHPYGSGWGFTGQSASISVAPNQWHSLEIEAVGNEITTRIDGKKTEVLVDHDAAIASGAIALLCQYNSTVQFQEILIQELANDHKADERRQESSGNSAKEPPF